MATIKRVDDESSAAALADLLNGGKRHLPVVVVTTPAGRSTPWIDVEQIAEEAGDLAEIYLMPTGSFTWEFSRRMADGTQVYGGAGRVYPVGHAWASDVTKAPLRFAFDAVDGRRATQQIISDALRMAASAGLLQQPVATPQVRQVTGTVTGVIAGRAIVPVGSRMATIAEDLTVEDVPIERLVEAGQEVAGTYDPATNRIDVRASLRPAEEALAGYAAGDVVLARVAKVRNGKAELVLYPKTSAPEVRVAVLRADVTANPADDLRTLMTVGEVVAARVGATGPQWALALHDVDDNEPVAPAPSLLPDGPPWLVEDAETDLDEETVAAPTLPHPSAAPAPPVEQRPEPEPEPPRPAIPTPAIFDKRRRQAGPPPAPAPRTAAPKPAPRSAGTKDLLRKIDGLNADVNALKREQEELRAQIQAGDDERAQLRYLLSQAEHRANRAEHELKNTRARLRKAGSSKRADVEPAAGPQFADPEQGFRYLVLTRWATRTLPGEQAERPLPDYLLGPRFLESLDKLEGIKTEKIADVVFEVLTGLAAQTAGRELHHLRTGPGGEDPVRTRDDGAVAWRASLQVKTPSARRLHYWVLPDGTIELARVATHDDFEA
ncbi:MAG: hypothetical protein QM621_14715 [Aeromicrobium sp.]|uniref:hypothetical protein n=1 Tax=Aeromicrobium sp. TaxID=1871063 RepID=UPI0039E25AD1